MQKMICQLTVCFETPFWIGVYERIADGKLEVCKITFGAEPKDYEVQDFLLKNWNYLTFSPPIRAERGQDRKINPKRLHRIIQKQLEVQTMGTKSQQALKLQHEENKTNRKENNRRKKEEEQQKRFELRQRKKKEKHRGK